MEQYSLVLRVGVQGFRGSGVMTLSSGQLDP
jgi:hypothetical protein